MTALPLETLAQGAVERMFNSLPEGLLIALFAWAVLRVFAKQNSRTRFAVWFFALLGVACVPWADGLLTGAPSESWILGPASGGTGVLARLGSAGVRSAISLPSHWAPYILIMWLLTTLVILMRLAVGLWRLRQLQRSCRPVEMSALDPSLRQTFDELSAAKSFATRRITLATSDRVRVPAALGLWNPTIVLPTWALRELPSSDLSIILRHEFAHLRRWDDWTNLTQKIVHALFFFHPAVWWIESRLSVEREMACDDVVVAQTDNPTGYAACLVSLLERSLAQRGWTMAQAIVHRAREASLRLTQILDKNRPAATQISKPALGLVGAFTLLCLIMLPGTPQVISFEQSAPPSAGPEFSATLAQPASLPPSMIHRASVQTSADGIHRANRQPSPDARSAAADPSGGADLQRVREKWPSRSPVAQQLQYPSPGGAPANSPALQRREKGQDQISPAGTTDLLAHTLQACDEAAAKPCGVSRRGDHIRASSNSKIALDEAIAEDSLAAAVSNSLLDVAAFADQNLQPGVPTVVLVHATQFVESDSGSDYGFHYTVWRIQVWRLTVVNPLWKHPPQVPIPHST